MKFTFAAIAAALACGTASAQTVEVPIPQGLETPAVAAEYTDQLLAAISTVCARSSAPVIGINYYTFRACVKQTRIDTAAHEPTGLLAVRLGIESPVRVASR